ncbi:uncharacterized protein LOC120351472 [Nilaparvata lugens]|uniref:uncharacterized protein LOC120351472 n=1 Tax=Nilaparvata lugens TaxID=108931 RepID=UPI00193E7890|nr:uncharacterized protein LOC120351472 [Nilaparvata lugens]
MIDYILYQGDLRYAVRDVKVIRGAELDTDHRLLVADTGFVERKDGRQKAYMRIKHEELRSRENRERYQTELSARIENWQTQEERYTDVDKFWSDLKEAVTGAAKEVCGERKVGKFKKRTRWWSEEVKRKVKEKKKAYKKYMISKRQEDFRKYVEKRNDAKRSVKLAKIQAWEDFGRDLHDQHGQDNGRAFWETVKHLRGKFGKNVRTIVNEDGRLVSQMDEVLERWRRFYEVKFRDNNEHMDEENDQNEDMPMLDEIEGITSDITRDEVEENEGW